MDVGFIISYESITGNDEPPGYEVLNAQSRTTEITNMFACNKTHFIRNIAPYT
jgi:hypothetical protein